MELVREAGVDVSLWRLRSDGTEVANPAENPNYCYDWSFGSAVDAIVLCVWWANLDSKDGQIVYEENVRQLAEELRRIATQPNRSGADRDRARQQAGRARDFDERVREAYERLLPVRMVINEGDRKERDELGKSSSRVAKRALDSESWFVHKYDSATGNCRLVRGIKPSEVAANAGEVALDDWRGPEDELQLRAINIRRGQDDFRQRLLSAWRRSCVVTRCTVVELLEAAHIVPHADETDYRTCNGLLLRADIHTLYDLGLLSIDEQMRVHLASELLQSEYRQYDAKKIERLPDRGEDAPSRDALRKRHEQFLSRRAKSSVR